MIIPELDLNQLTLDIFSDTTDSEIEDGFSAIHTEMEFYRKKYGKDWIQYYGRAKGDIVEYDRDMKTINSLIALGKWTSIVRLREKQKQRLEELFRKPFSFYDHFEKEDCDISNLLVNDAIKSGKWKELPDNLQPSYHERKKDGTK